MLCKFLMLRHCCALATFCKRHFTVSRPFGRWIFFCKKADMCPLLRASRASAAASNLPASRLKLYYSIYYPILFWSGIRIEFHQIVDDRVRARRNLSRGFSAKVTNYSIDVFDNLFLRVSLRQFYIKFYAFSLSKTVEKRSSVDYTKRLSNTSNKFFSANCLTTSCIVSSTKFAYSSFDIVINLFMDLSRSGK